jgi:hypothetical protein
MYMAGGLMQLVAYGAEDIYLTGNPQITFFKVVYRRYTNFSIEVIEHPFIGEPGFDKRVTSRITRNGDLVNKMYLRVFLNPVDPLGTSFAWIRRLGHAIIRQVEVELGGTKFDRQYGTWLDIWYELARKGDHERGYAKLIGDVPELTTYDNTVKPAYTLYIPLQFWFNRFIGLSIPLIALQYHEMNINVEFNAANNIIIRDCNFDVTRVTMRDATILVNYIYLDTEERRRFAQVGHEYLIEQIQFNGEQLVPFQDVRYNLDFNHPTKELFWVMKNGNYTSGKTFVYYTNQDTWSIDDASCVIIRKSVSIGNDPTDVSGGTWVEVLPSTSATVGTFNVKNDNSLSIWFNPTSLRVGAYGITNKINADVTITFEGDILCENIVTTLTIRDLSIPVEDMVDTRFNVCDPIVHQFTNYGVLIDGTVNPVRDALLQLNGHDRFDRREGAYFNYVQPEQCHENTPADGINVYSFSLFPEEHQPSGTANLSRISRSDLFITFTDPTQTVGVPSLHIINTLSRTFIYALNYNIQRVYSGLTALAYTTT